MVGRIVVMLFALVGCGRIGFDATTGGADQTPGDSTTRTYLFQDGFEGTLAPWGALGNVAVDTGLSAMEGSSILKAQANTADSARAEVNLVRTIGNGSTFYVRAYYYLPSGYSISDLSLLEIVQNQTDNLVVMSIPEIAYLSKIDNSGGTGNYVVPRDTWLCIETRVGIADSPNGTIDIWIDGVPRFSKTGIDTLTVGIDELHTGVTWAGVGQAPATVYVDDVIADDAGPIGCN